MGATTLDVSSDPDERKATRPSTSGSLIEGYGGRGLCSEAPSGNSEED
jgi:hypothetical protein